MKRVNHVLKVHGSNIDKFRVCFEVIYNINITLMDGLILQSQRELRGLNWTFHTNRGMPKTNVFYIST